MQNGRIVAGFARLTLGMAFVGVGVLGIVRALAPVSPVARLTRPQPSHQPFVQYAGQRVEALRAALHGMPDDPELHLKLARSYAARATVLAHQEYSDAFPDAFVYGRYPITHYEDWRRGWFHSDRDGDLRHALYHGRRAATDSSRSVRLVALQLIVNVLRQRSSDKAAIAVLEQMIALAPDDPMAWFQLSEVYRVTGDLARFRAARLRLDAIRRRLSALPLRLDPIVPTRGFVGRMV